MGIYMFSLASFIKDSRLVDYIVSFATLIFAIILGICSVAFAINKITKELKTLNSEMNDIKNILKNSKENK